MTTANGFGLGLNWPLMLKNPGQPDDSSPRLSTDTDAPATDQPSTSQAMAEHAPSADAENNTPIDDAENQATSDATSDLTQLTDEALVARLQAGESVVFPVLVERYRNDLFRFLMRFMSNRAWAEDVFQDTFFQVHQSASTFDTDKRFKPWLFKIAANKARDQLRKNKRRRAVSLNMSLDGAGDGDELVDLMEGDWLSPHGQAQDAELGQQVRLVVESMPDHLRAVLVMAYFQQMAYRDVADALSIPLGTVKSRLHAAVGTFAKLWKAQHGEVDPLSP